LRIFVSRFVDAVEMETEIQLKIEHKDYKSALRLCLTAKEKADGILSDADILQ